jgi:predicted sulfurtransferase
LAGGIERYLQAYPDGGGFWTGKNFVFDKREAVSASNPKGDGGVVGKVKPLEKEKPISTCCVCGDPWDRYVGKKKCYTCGVPVLMCAKCQSMKPDKDPEKMMSVRCPLCVAENVTVPASEVEFTANGIKSKDPVAARKQREEAAQSEKAANSVLKWGGGHAAKKKLEKKMKRRLCKFGSDCKRSDCFFAHPEREQSEAKKSRNSVVSP